MCFLIFLNTHQLLILLGTVSRPTPTLMSCVGLETFNGKETRGLLWAGSLAARGQMTVSGTPNSQNYCVSFL
jgi:hypothetical protein